MVLKVSNLGYGSLGFFFTLLIKLLCTECEGITFGPGCINMCGKCARNEHCHHVNGSCMNGCDPGYYGPQCTKCKQSGRYSKCIH